MAMRDWRIAAMWTLAAIFRSAARDSRWEESKHPRDKEGKFKGNGAVNGRRVETDLQNAGNGAKIELEKRIAKGTRKRQKAIPMRYRESTEHYEKRVAQTWANQAQKKLEFYRKKNENKVVRKAVSDKRFEQLVIRAKKIGAIIIRGGEEVEKHLDNLKADAATMGDVILLRKNATVSEILEETYHVEQNKAGRNNDKDIRLRNILNEIDAKEYLLKNKAKYNITRAESGETEKQLKQYKKLLREYEGK